MVEALFFMDINIAFVFAFRWRRNFVKLWYKTAVIEW